MFCFVVNDVWTQVLYICERELSWKRLHFFQCTTGITYASLLGARSRWMIQHPKQMYEMTIPCVVWYLWVIENAILTWDWCMKWNSSTHNFLWFLVEPTSWSRVLLLWGIRLREQLSTFSKNFVTSLLTVVARCSYQQFDPFIRTRGAKKDVMYM